MAVGVPEESIRIVTPGSTLSEPHPSGLLLCGGLDVDPARFGEAVLPDANVEVNGERDQLEWDLLDLARERRLPVWGVCRGIQVLNVYLGGSLWQDLPTQAPSAIDHSQSETPDQLAHTVQVIEPGAPVGERLTGTGRTASASTAATTRRSGGWRTASCRSPSPPTAWSRPPCSTATAGGCAPSSGTPRT